MDWKLSPQAEERKKEALHYYLKERETVFMEPDCAL
jgi:hypothetical protein